MAYLPLLTEKQTFWTSAGAIASGYKLFIYLAGTTTKATTYQETTGTANTNPVVLNSRGEVPYGVYVAAGSTYKLVLAPSTDSDPPVAPVWTRDNLSATNDTTVTVDQWQASGFTPTYVSATSFTVTGDRTSTFQVGRRIKSTNTGGTIYSTITVSAYSSVTTVTVVNDSGVLDSGLSAVSVGLLTPTSPSNPVLTDAYPLVSGSSDKTKKLRVEIDGLTTSTTRVLTVQDRDIIVADVLDTHGACRLAKSGANLVLSPFNGNTLVINSVLYEIPDAGVTLAPSGLSTSTMYYIYAYISGSTMTLENSTTAYAVQAGTGVYIKSGDATRTLVGIEYATGATTWAGYVRSWFNDPGFTNSAVLTADRTTASATFVEINSEIRTNFLSWTGEIVQAALRANVASNTGGSSNVVGMSFDGGTAEDGAISAQTTSVAGDVNILKNASGVWHKSGLTEGFHYATMFVKTSSGTTTARGGSNPDRTLLSVFLKK
jgi:hypothetical protein